MEARVITLHGEGAFDDALEVARAAAERFPSRTAYTAYWVACVHGAAGRPRAALRALGDALERTDVWWGPELLAEDPDLESIRTLEGFDDVLTECERRGEAARRAARVRWRALDPAGGRGHLVVLHGRTGNVEDLADRWGPASPPGVTTVVVQSSQLVAAGMSCWDDLDVAASDLATVATEALDPDAPVVLAGFSQGGGVATRLALVGEPVAARGFVAIAASFFRDGLAPGDLAEPAPRAAREGVRGWLSIGRRDTRYHPRAEEVAVALQRAGVAVRWRVFDDLGHDYPAPFAAHLSAAVDFVLDANAFQRLGGRARPDAQSGHE